jgi:uncharacterized protein (DUF1499 family)
MIKQLWLQILIGVAIVVVAGMAVLAILARAVKKPANLGVHDGKLAPCPPYPNCVSTQAQDPRHQIAPIRYGGPAATTNSHRRAAEAMAALLEVLQEMERTRIAIDEPTYIHAECQTAGMGYIDDVEFYLDESAQVIHFRSGARLPYWDWNVNRKRMESIRQAFEAKMR